MSNVFVSLNCVLNPIIYGFLNRSYRKVILRKIKYAQHKLGKLLRAPIRSDSCSPPPKYAQAGAFEITTELVEIQVIILYSSFMLNTCISIHLSRGIKPNLGILYRLYYLLVAGSFDYSLNLSQIYQAKLYFQPSPGATRPSSFKLQPKVTITK